MEPPTVPPPTGITFVITSFLAGLVLVTGVFAAAPAPTAGSLPELSWKARNSKATAKIASAANTVGRGRGLPSRLRDVGGSVAGARRSVISSTFAERARGSQCLGSRRVDHGGADRAARAR